MTPGMLRAESGRFLPGVHAYRRPQLHWNKDWLEQKYVIEQRSAAEIATLIGCGESNIDYWLKKHAVPRRSISEVRAMKHWGASGPANPMFGKIGALNPNYIDGSSPERQRMYASAVGRDFIRLVLNRDRYRCRRCRAKKAGPKSLHVHHRKQWAGNVALRFDPKNAVTLCRRCHHWVHSKQNSRRFFL